MPPVAVPAQVPAAKVAVPVQVTAVKESTSVPEVDPALQPDGVTTKATEVVRQQKKGAQNLTVAVRVRPLTQVERDRLVCGVKSSCEAV